MSGTLKMSELLQKEESIRPSAALQATLVELDNDIRLFLENDAKKDPSLLGERKVCPACGSAAVAAWDGASKPLPVSICQTCQFRFSPVYLTDAAWTIFHQQSKAGVLFHDGVVEKTRQKRAVVVDNPRADWVASHIDVGARILDVGCSTGGFLHVMKARGYECWGVEPNPEAARIARQNGLENVYHGTLETLSETTEFDAICAFGIFVHLNEPAETLRQIWRRLRPGGRLFLTDINFDGFLAAITGEEHESFRPPFVVNFFSLDVLADTLRRLAYVDIQAQTPGILDVVRIWNYWQSGGHAGRNPGLYRLIKHAVEIDDAGLQEMIINAKASEHMWVSAQKGA